MKVLPQLLPDLGWEIEIGTLVHIDMLPSSVADLAGIRRLGFRRKLAWQAALHLRTIILFYCYTFRT